MKICIVTHNVFKGDGQGRVNYEITQAALDKGYEVTLVASRVSPDLQNHPNLKWVYIDVSHIFTVLGEGIVFCLKSTAWLKRNRYEFDALMVNGALTNASSDINAVHFVHTAWLKSPAHTWRCRKNISGLYQLFYSLYNSHREKKAFSRARLIVAVSEKVKCELVEIGVPSEKICVILNGVNLKEFTPGTVDRSTWNLPKEKSVALFVGDIRSNRKNLDTVLLALVNSENLHLAVAGETRNSPYPQLAQKLGISNRVHFLGYRRDIADIMKAVDFFVFPSRYEACTLALMEALASGLPVITANSTGGSEVITSDCGFVLTNSDDHQLLGKYMTVLSDDLSLRERLRKSASKQAQQYGWACTVQKYLDLFEQTNRLASNKKEYGYLDIS
jgi:glycosyltransferase involved in cell wall biosynthesis